MKTEIKYYSWDDLEIEVKKAEEYLSKRLTIGDLCREYHKTRSIHAACMLADLLYELDYN